MGTLSEVIARHQSEIVHHWRAAAQQAPSARELTAKEIEGTIPVFLSLLGQPAHNGGGLSAEQLALIEHHLSSRLRCGFNLNEILTEYSSLGRFVLDCVKDEAAADASSSPDLARLSAELMMVSAQVTRIFNEQLLEDEQTLKRYLRLLANVGIEHVTLRRSRLDRALGLVMEAMGAHTAALLLFEAKSGDLVMTASVGDAKEHLAEHVAALGDRSFAAKVASVDGEAVAVSDAGTTELRVSDTLRQSGIHSLLGVRLAVDHSLRGVVYIGVRDERAFAPNEARRLESLGEALSVHLDNARLFTALRRRSDEAAATERQNERFIEVLMKDLRGPLAQAQADAQRLRGTPEIEAVAAKIVGGLEGARRKIDALLDAHRIRAGERLRLNITDCNLTRVAHEVIDERRAAHGDRFFLRADPHVAGMWDREQLHRALGNLVDNAVQHGPRNTPILISVRAGDNGAELAVHDEGPGISTAEQARLFQPFSHARAALATPHPGWGLGLTLVWGCVDAHGGRVGVESAPGKGTTFTLSIPSDARPYRDN